jgi:hypothetical protein
MLVAACPMNLNAPGAEHAGRSDEIVEEAARGRPICRRERAQHGHEGEHMSDARRAAKHDRRQREADRRHCDLCDQQQSPPVDAIGKRAARKTAGRLHRAAHADTHADPQRRVRELQHEPAVGERRDRPSHPGQHRAQPQPPESRNLVRARGRAGYNQA